MKFLKTSAIALIIASLFFFVGCGEDNQEVETAAKTTKAAAEENDEQKEDKNDASEEAKASNDEQSAEPVEIEFWYGLGSVAGETMEKIIAEFNESQDKVHVTGVQQPGYDETFQKVQAAIAAKKPPAVFIAEFVGEMARRGVLQPLNEFMDERTPADDYLEVFLDPATFDGQIYAMPAYGTTQVIYYKKDLLEKGGVDPEEMYSSWENIFKYSKQLQDDGIVEYGHLPMWGPNNMVDIARSNGGRILSEDGTKVTINSPEWIEAWEFIRKQIHEDKTTVIESGGQGWEYWYRTIDNVMQGKVVSYTGSSGDKGDLDFEIIDSTVQPGMGDNPGKPQSNGLFMAIPAIAEKEQQKAAFEWIAYFTSPENSARWSIEIGYIPVRKSTMDVDIYKEYVEANPYGGVPYKQALTALPSFDDITNGKILDAISIATDKVQLENVPAEEALNEAQEVAQKALDEALAK